MFGYGQGKFEKKPIKEEEHTKETGSLTKVVFRNDGASMSSTWKDDRIKPYNPFKTTEFSARFGSGAFTCIHTMNDKEGAWWKAEFGYSPTIAKV